MEIRYLGGWIFYLSGEEKKLDVEKCGKWLFFFDFENQQLAQDICSKAIKEKVCYECKCTDIYGCFTHGIIQKTGVICFYCNGDDIENHKQIIQFMLDNNLIAKTKAGKLYNISFKFDNQTRAGEYGADFEGKIKLEQFIDLWTGEWK